MAAAFASPMSAVDAAIDAQRELQLPVRMGIATGEAELRDRDYFGTVLNRAARVMAAGHGGQTLIADSTAGLLSDVDLTNLGPRRLRDLPNPIAIFQLAAPGLQTDFPPLRTIDSSQGNLRPIVGRLIGREAEVAEVASAVRSHRLVTMTGVGGVGKTRLALEVASILADEFPDGVWVFELASVADPSVVPDAVASVLGITQQPGMSVGESVAAALEGRIRLLVFDNCEHVVDAVADLVESILAQSATVKILSTSREGLGLADERLWRVPSLDVRAAVELYTERTRALSVDELSAVEEVCRRLDGIPLAIELAASRMESMTATEVRDRLDHRFKLLVRSRRGLERHQTLRHAVAWSYDLLDEPEKALLGRCSVFAGGFDVQGASAIAGSEDEFKVLDLLDALVRKSLLVADRSTGRTRFSMLETIRQFAEEKLVAGGEADEVSSQHARYFASREAEILELWDSPSQREAYGWVRHRIRQSACSIPLGCRPRRPRSSRHHCDIRRVSRPRCRELRAGRVGRGIDRTCAGNRPPATSGLGCDRVAVLDAGSGRSRPWLSRYRGVPAQFEPAYTAVCDGKLAWVGISEHRPARAGGRIVRRSARSPRRQPRGPPRK